MATPVAHLHAKAPFVASAGLRIVGKSAFPAPGGPVAESGRTAGGEVAVRFLGSGGTRRHRIRHVAPRPGLCRPVLGALFQPPNDERWRSD